MCCKPNYTRILRAMLPLALTVVFFNSGTDIYIQSDVDRVEIL